MAKRKINQLFDYLYEYYQNHEEELYDLFELIKFPIDDEDENTKDMVLINVVHSLMGIAVIVKAEKTIIEINDVEFLAALNKKEYDLCRIILLDYFYHAFIGVNVKWVDEPTKLSRHILVPIRNRISDLMYAIVTSLRADEKQMMQLNTPFVSFIETNNPLENYSHLYDTASIYPLLSLMDCKNIRLSYGDLLDYEFKVKLTKIRYISNPELYSKNVIVKKANGYGIYENKIEDLYSYLFDPSSIELPFDFNDANILELNQYIELDFELAKLHYQGIDIDAFIESLTDELEVENVETIEA